MDEDKHQHTVWLTDKAWVSGHKDDNCTKQNKCIEKLFLRPSKKPEWFYHLHQCIQRKACQYPHLK